MADSSGIASRPPCHPVLALPSHAIRTTRCVPGSCPRRPTRVASPSMAVWWSHVPTTVVKVSNHSAQVCRKATPTIWRIGTGWTLHQTATRWPWHRPLAAYGQAAMRENIGTAYPMISRPWQRCGLSLNCDYCRTTANATTCVHPARSRPTGRRQTTRLQRRRLRHKTQAAGMRTHCLL